MSGSVSVPSSASVCTVKFRQQKWALLQRLKCVTTTPMLDCSTYLRKCFASQAVQSHPTFHQVRGILNKRAWGVSLSRESGALCVFAQLVGICTRARAQWVSACVRAYVNSNRKLPPQPPRHRRERADKWRSHPYLGKYPDK